MKNSVIRPLAAFAVLAQQMALSPNIHASTALATFGNLGASTESESVCAPQETITRKMADRMAEDVTDQLVKALKEQEINTFFLPLSSNYRRGEQFFLSPKEKFGLQMRILEYPLYDLVFKYEIDEEIIEGVMQFFELNHELELKKNDNLDESLNTNRKLYDAIYVSISDNLSGLGQSSQKSFQRFKEKMVAKDKKNEQFFEAMAKLPTLEIRIKDNGRFKVNYSYTNTQFNASSSINNYLSGKSDVVKININIDDTRYTSKNESERKITSALFLNDVPLVLPELELNNLNSDDTKNIIKTSLKNSISEAIIKHTEEARKKNPLMVDQCNEVAQDPRNADESNDSTLDAIIDSKSIQGTRR